jgi:xylan 1,4-beta-xylosidase
MMCLTSIFAAGAAFAGVVADSTADFSGVQGGKNWYYGFLPAGDINSFTPLSTYNTQSRQWQHTMCCPPWTLIAANSVIHPNGAPAGAEEWATRQWVSNYVGRVMISGRLAKIDTNPASTGVYGRIYWNRQLVYEHLLAGTDGTGVNYSLTLSLRIGDILHFAVAPNGNPYNDSTVFSSRISSERDAATIDFGSPVTVKTALGILNGFDFSNPPGPNPPANLIFPLQPRFWRGTANIYQRVRSVASTIPFQLLLMVGWPANNYDQLGPPWQNWTGYESRLRSMLAPFVPLPANVIFEPWNEADDGWAFPPGSPGYKEFWNGTKEQFYESYLRAFRTIRAVLGPNALVAGPSFATYDHRGMEEFLEFCLANGCEVNSLTWHELNDSSSIAALAANVQDARTSFLRNPRYAPLRTQRIDINEIVGGVFTHQPAGTLAYYSALEASEADGGTRSCWVLSTGVSECFNGTLGGLLTSGTFQPRSVWWLHKAYADGVSGRVRAVVASPNIVVMASNSVTGENTPQILVGNFDFTSTVSNTSSQANVTISLKNLQALRAIGQQTNVPVRVELIPNTGEAALGEPKLLAQMNVAVKAGEAQVTLPPLQMGDVFRVTLVSPVTAEVATIASDGAVDPWNYTAGAAPGAWVTIVGLNLGPAVPQSWNPQPGAPLPTSLGGVSVSIAGMPAPLSFVSASQINALVPAKAPLGTSPLVVTVNGVPGTPYMIHIASAHPGVYSLSDPASPETLYVTATLGGTSTLIGKPGVDPRVTRGAREGELVDLYMVGLGPTLHGPLFVTDRLFSTAAPIAGNVSIHLGGQLLSPTFAGLVAPGLYLVRFAVPKGILAGDHPLLIGVNGIFTRDRIYFTIAPN